LVRDKYGSEHYSKIGQMGGSTRKAQLGDEGYAEMGRRGGLRVSEDRAHMAELGKKGGTNRGINIRKEKEAEKSA
jgi:general stress protein YciG